MEETVQVILLVSQEGNQERIEGEVIDDLVPQNRRDGECDVLGASLRTYREADGGHPNASNHRGNSVGASRSNSGAFRRRKHRRPCDQVGTSRANSRAHRGRNHRCPRVTSDGAHDQSREVHLPEAGAGGVARAANSGTNRRGGQCCPSKSAQQRMPFDVTVEVPEALVIDRSMDIPVVQPRQTPMQSMGTVVDMLLCGATPGAHGSEGADDTRGATVAVHR